MFGEKTTVEENNNIVLVHCQKGEAANDAVYNLGRNYHDLSRGAHAKITSLLYRGQLFQYDTLLTTH